MLCIVTQSCSFMILLLFMFNFFNFLLCKYSVKCYEVII